MQRFLLSLMLMMFLNVSVSAEDRAQHGDWSSQFLEDMGEVTTHENGMSTFGMLCANNSCRYYFANGIDCEPGGNYPLMLTTDVGALSVEGVCEPVSTANGDILVYWFNETESMNQAFQKTRTLGFAFPLTNGQFKTSTFSMDGFTTALDRMVNGLRGRPQPAEGQTQHPEAEELQEVRELPAGST